MSNYTFDDPAGDSNANPDWKMPVPLETGTYTATLTRAEVKANPEKGSLAVLAEFAVEVPGEVDSVPHEEWLTTHRVPKGGSVSAPTKMIGGTLKMIGAITGLESRQCLNGLVVSANHARFNELLATRVGRVFELGFKRSADGQYLNLNKIAET